MHSKDWQAVCGFITDACESLSGSGGTMRELFDLMTEGGSAPVYSWKENGRLLYMRREDLRRKAVAAAKKLMACVPEGHRMIGLHASDPMYWPVWYWAILMSGHVPLILDPGRELFSYRSLKDCEGAYCITRDRNYGWTIDPEALKKSASEVDPAFFDDIWADETCFVSEDANGRLAAVIHSGASLCAQVLRLRHMYRYDQLLLYPPQDGRIRLLLDAPLHDPFAFLFGAIAYPLFGCEVYLAPGEAGDVRLSGAKATHMCLSAEGCANVKARLVREAQRLYPKLSARYTAWLDGKERINDYRVLSRFQAMSGKLGRRVLGKKARCVLCGGEDPDTSAAGFFSRFGLFFSGGLWCGPLGLVAMELSGEPELRSKGSVGELLEGLSGFDAGEGRLLVNCEGPVGKYLQNGKLRDPEMPFPLPRKAYFNRHGRLCLEERAARGKDAPAADPQVVQRLREIYANVLDRPVGIIGENMDFFADLGGDSLTYFLLLQHIEAAFGVRIPADERAYFITVRFAAETLSNDVRKVATNDA